MKKALLLIAHGSPRQEANDDFAGLAKQVQERAKGYIVQHAFLDCAQPNIPEGIDQLAKKSATNITILPYFLSKGKHTTSDIPLIIEQKEKQYQKIRFTIKPALGTLPEMEDLILRVINK